MIRRVLVALDDSVRAPKVFQRAVEFARPSAAELILLRVAGVPQEFPASAAGNPPDALRAKMLEDAREELLSYVSNESELPTRIVVMAELSADRAIVAAAEKFDVDLIVIGNHGYHGVDRLIGTTAGYVVHLAKRDVLIVYRDGE